MKFAGIFANTKGLLILRRQMLIHFTFIESVMICILIEWNLTLFHLSCIPLNRKRESHSIERSVVFR